MDRNYQARVAELVAHGVFAVPLKYADPEMAKDEAYQFYQLCVDKWRRTGHSKDQIEMVRARKEFQRLSQYARNHKAEPRVDADPKSIMTYLHTELTSQREKNAQLRRAVSIANAMLDKYLWRLEQAGDKVDSADREVIQNLRKLTRESNKVRNTKCAPPDP